MLEMRPVELRTDQNCRSKFEKRSDESRNFRLLPMLAARTSAKLKSARSTPQSR